MPFVIAFGRNDEQVPIARARNFINDNDGHENMKIVETDDMHNMKSLVDHSDTTTPNLVDLINDVYENAMKIDGYNHEKRFPVKKTTISFPPRSLQTPDAIPESVIALQKKFTPQPKPKDDSPTPSILYYSEIEKLHFDEESYY